MATDKRTYPNNYFAWYNDDQRLAILCEDTTSTSGERTKEKYDTYQGSDVSAGIRITYTAKYGTIDAQTEDLKTEAGLDSGLHPMYDKMVKQYPLRKSGVRALSVPRM